MEILPIQVPIRANIPGLYINPPISAGIGQYSAKLTNTQQILCAPLSIDGECAVFFIELMSSYERISYLQQTETSTRIKKIQFVCWSIFFSSVATKFCCLIVGHLVVYWWIITDIFLAWILVYSVIDRWILVCIGEIHRRQSDDLSNKLLCV